MQSDYTFIHSSRSCLELGKTKLNAFTVNISVTVQDNVCKQFNKQKEELMCFS